MFVLIIKKTCNINMQNQDFIDNGILIADYLKNEY